MKNFNGPFCEKLIVSVTKRAKKKKKERSRSNDFGSDEYSYSILYSDPRISEYSDTRSRVGYESHDRAAPEGAAAPKIAAPEIYFSLLEAQRGLIPFFFSLYQLQIVLLTIANKKNISFPEIMIL